ncbi:hypothetical protein HETIRDRAFT_449542 [Heterobasidion irregulare TC 32-1]|uniref:Uncharacterized protein n=1 Tax=Heterobasidion irregulare (strain TC 32-1) TaxID=747525 RepID=W4KFV6_HETIT|nr:uncharacterized protein HETIRDRAFT_449542 [Heterobasidion irregulare TC 32-1]ETW83936.1 hypothetical protein HETIRDRAFT_449542 [Heterobasidion irregulare TC 32-1]
MSRKRHRTTPAGANDRPATACHPLTNPTKAGNACEGKPLPPPPTVASLAVPTPRHARARIEHGHHDHNHDDDHDDANANANANDECRRSPTTQRRADSFPSDRDNESVGRSQLLDGCYSAPGRPTIGTSCTQRASIGTPLPVVRVRVRLRLRLRLRLPHEKKHGHPSVRRRIASAATDAGGFHAPQLGK